MDNDRLLHIFTLVEMINARWRQRLMERERTFATMDIEAYFITVRVFDNHGNVKVFRHQIAPWVLPNANENDHGLLMCEEYLSALMAELEAMA